MRTPAGKRWRAAPERFKLQVRLVLTARKRGLSPQEAVRYANEEIAREDAEAAERQRDAETKTEALRAAEAKAAASADTFGPRIRSL